MKKQRGLSVLILCLTGMTFGQGVFEKRVAPISPGDKQSFTRHVKVALVIGISAYPEASGLQPLQFAAADAKDLGALLSEQGYKVRVLADIEATGGAIEQSIQDLGEMVDGPQGTFLFYFSGHGFSVGGKNYLVPVSASLNRINREGLAIEDVEQLMAQSKSKRQIMLLDACRSDNAAGQKAAGGRSFSAFQAAEGLRILNSTQLNKVSYESPELRHGVFTDFVLKGLEGQAAGQDGLITFFDLAAYVTNAVRDWSFDHHMSQIPFDKTGQEEATGDFLLAGPMPQAAAGLQTFLPSRPTPSETSSLASAQSDVQIYIGAMALMDPAQVEAAADKISNPMYAKILRTRAQSLRTLGANSAGANSVSPTFGSAPGVVDARRKAQATYAKVEADSFAQRGNYQQAFPLYKQSAETGDSGTMVTVGMCYYKGLGTAKNYEEAVKWFQKAADLGEPVAMGRLGYMYTFAEGVKQDDSLAASWDRKAADAGDSVGMLGLGFMYQNGRGGLPKNTAQATVWFRKSAALGNNDAKEILQKLGLR